MPWIVQFFDEFEIEFDAFPQDVQDAILSRTLLLQREGPYLGRPHADTLKASRHANMKSCGAMPVMEFGAWLTPSTPTGWPFSSLQGTSPAAVRSAFTSS